MDIKTERVNFSLRNHEIPLDVSQDELFMPNATTRLFAKAITINPGDVVFDIGSGVGPLAIWSGLEDSSIVYAVEIVKEQCDLLRKNIKENEVEKKVKVYCGGFFDPIPEGVKADVIIGDVSGIAEGPARVLGWYPPYIPTGGRDGTEVIIPILERAGAYLKERGRLYFPVAIGLSDDEKIMKAARERFGKLEKKIDVNFPLTSAQRDAILERAGSEPYIKIGVRGSKYTWGGQIYEASEAR